MRVVIAAVIAAFALPAAAQDAVPRYAIDLSIMADGVEVTAARTMIVEGGQANVVLTGADGQHLLEANLHSPNRAMATTTNLSWNFI